MSRSRPQRPPLTPSDLERFALRYVERYATTRGRLTDYLNRKIRERGWAGGNPPDSRAMAERMAALGYIDDRAFAESRAGAMGRRGLGARRVHQALYHAGIEGEDADAIAPMIAADAEASAVAFARRRRIGPFALEMADRDVQQKQIAAMIRAGHALDIARRLARMAPGESVEALLGPDRDTP